MIDLSLLRQIRRSARVAARAAAKGVPIVTGSFVPTLVGSGVAGTFTYNANATLVEWTRIGNRLFFNGRLLITAITVAPTGNMSIDGWPFAGVSDSNMAIAGGAAMNSWVLNVVNGYTFVGGEFVNGSSSMALRASGDNLALVNVQGGEVIASTQFRFHGSYRIA